MYFNPLSRQKAADLEAEMKALQAKASAAEAQRDKLRGQKLNVQQKQELLRQRRTDLEQQTDHLCKQVDLRHKEVQAYNIQLNRRLPLLTSLLCSYRQLIDSLKELSFTTDSVLQSLNGRSSTSPPFPMTERGASIKASSQPLFMISLAEYISAEESLSEQVRFSNHHVNFLDTLLGQLCFVLSSHISFQL